MFQGLLPRCLEPALPSWERSLSRERARGRCSSQAAPAQPLLTIVNPSPGERGFLSCLSEPGNAKCHPHLYPEKPGIHLMGGMAPYLTCDQEGTGQGTLLVLYCPSPGPHIHTEKGVVGKETKIRSKHPSLLCSGGHFPRWSPHSPRQPPPQGHTLPRVCCQEAWRLPLVPGAEQVNKWGIIVQTGLGPGSPEPLAGLPGRVGEQLGLCLGFQKQRTLGVTFRGGQEAGAPTQLRVWWVMGESREESCMFRKHTQWEG